MANYLDQIRQELEYSESINESEKQRILQHLSALQQEREENDFKLKRILKDKSIAVNILEATIQDLERKKLEVEEINQKLSFQQRELHTQKRIIEQNAKDLQNNLNKLALSYQELEQFSYIASHDLKSPLRTIASFAQLLERQYYDQLDEQAKEFIGFIVSGIDQMNEVIQGLLQYSQIGRQDSLLKLVDLNVVLEVVKGNLRKDMEENEVTIIHDHLPELYANRVGIIQLFQNLIHNAIKFKGNRPPLIKLCHRYLAEQQQWEFRLKDNGMGMSEEFQEKAFLPFQRVTTQKIAGLGIGLAICQKVVKLHYGEIRYESEPGEGTTFIFTLSGVAPA